MRPRGPPDSSRLAEQEVGRDCLPGQAGIVPREVRVSFVGCAHGFRLADKIHEQLAVHDDLDRVRPLRREPSEGNLSHASSIPSAARISPPGWASRGANTARGL